MIKENEIIESFLALNGIDSSLDDILTMKQSNNENMVKRYIRTIRFIDVHNDVKIDYVFLRIINDLISMDKLMINKENLEQDITTLLSVRDPIERAGKILIYLTKKNVFKSNNIETAILFVNSILIPECEQVLIIPKNFIHTFYELIEEDERLTIDFISHFCLKRSLF